MPSQEYLEELAENIENMEVGLDHAFKFKCHGCGKCCKNREDILLTSRDLYNIAKCLKMKTTEVIDKYCELYIGGNSRLPIIRLKPVGQNKKCPLLQEKRCIVHTSKPVVCALFPLGRFVMFDNVDLDNANENDLIVRYLVNPVECGGHRNNTVRSWIESFGIDPDDRWYRLWTMTTMRLGNYVRNLETSEKKLPKAAFDAIWTISIELLYARYDIEKEYESQFEANLAEMRRMLHRLDTELIQPFLSGKPLPQVS